MNVNGKSYKSNLERSRENKQRLRKKNKPNKSLHRLANRNKVNNS
jgi:5-bromo-4-chloroindolyl phosphate hydrolysis protein